MIGLVSGINALRHIGAALKALTYQRKVRFLTSQLWVVTLLITLVAMKDCDYICPELISFCSIAQLITPTTFSTVR